MQYKITYVAPKRYTIGGFGVMFKEVIYDLFCLSQTTEIKNFHVDWTNKNIPYYDINKGDNVWDYYFHNNKKENELTDYYNTIKPNLDSTHLNKVFINMNHDTPIDKNKIYQLNETYKKYIHIKDEILKNVDDYSFKNFTGNTLGVQYRYTDKIKEVNQITPTKLINIIRNCVGDYDTIFIATDYQPVIDELTKLSKKIKFNDIVRSSNSTGSHFLKNDREYDNYLKGYECLIDILMLSKCDDYYYSKSNISLIPLIINNMGYNNIKLINNL